MQSVVESDPKKQLALFFCAGLKSNGTRRERRLYQRLWARVRRLDPKFRAAEASRMRERSKRAGEKEADARRHANWYRENVKHMRTYNAKWHREHRQRRCAFCARKAGKGRYCLRPVKRMVLVDGKFVEKNLLWCGC